MAKGCETHSRPHNSFDWFRNRKALAVTFNLIKWPAFSGALQHEFIALLVFDAAHTGERLCAIRSWPGEKGPLTPYVPCLSSEDGVYLRKGKPLGRYIYKEFRGCVVILLRWLRVREAIPSQNVDLFRPGHSPVTGCNRTPLLTTVHSELWVPVLGTVMCFCNKFFPVCCELFPGTQMTQWLNISL